MSRRRRPRIAVAVLVSAVTGLVYLLVNAAALSGPAALAIRVGGIVLFVGALLAVRAMPRTERDASQGGFGAGYWSVVAVEVVVGLGGAWVLTQVLDAPRATLPWVTLVVGVHFFGLGVLLASSDPARRRGPGDRLWCGWAGGRGAGCRRRGGGTARWGAPRGRAARGRLLGRRRGAATGHGAGRRCV